MPILYLRVIFYFFVICVWIIILWYICFVVGISRPLDTVHRPWSSTDSSGYSTDSSSTARLMAPKAHSFGGVTVLSRAERAAERATGLALSKSG